MPTEAEISAVAVDLRRLYDGGSGNPVLLECTTILSLAPVASMARHVEAHEAARNFLKMAVQFGLTSISEDERWLAVVAGALSGINPHQIGTGKRDDPGVVERCSNAGELHRPKRSARSMQIYIEKKSDPKYFRAYARVILAFAITLPTNEELLAKYRKRCRLDMAEAVAVVDSVESAVGESAEVGIAQADPSGNKKPEISDAEAILKLPPDKELLASLNSCYETMNRLTLTYRSAYLLLALFSVRDEKLRRCLNDFENDLGDRLLAWTRGQTSRLADDRGFEHFNWAGEPPLRRGRKLGLAQGAVVLTELHTFVGFLQSDSGTQEFLLEWLKDKGINVEILGDHVLEWHPPRTRTRR